VLGQEVAQNAKDWKHINNAMTEMLVKSENSFNFEKVYVHRCKISTVALPNVRVKN